MTNSFNYKGFDLSFQLIYYGGHVMRDVMARYIISPEEYNQGKQTNLDRDIANYWKRPMDSNDPSKSPAIYRNASSNITRLWYGADKHILPADYVKLREINLSYSLPRRLLQKAYVSDLTITFQIQNLWHWAANDKGLDPEVWDGTKVQYDYDLPTRGYPVPKIYSLGLNVRF